MSAVELPDLQLHVRRERRRQRTVERRKQLLGWVVALLVVGVWSVTFRPVALGGPASFVGVDGTSMLPAMRKGDMALTRRHATYGVGDVIAYRVPKGEAGEGNNIIHRIVGGNGRTGYTTKGDNNSYTDIWHPTDRDVIGVVWMRIPRGASTLARLRTPGVLAIFVGLTSFVVMLLPDRKRS